jgi:hypothetical protein
VTRILPKLDLRIGPETRKFIDAVNATGDPARDNELVEEFLAAEADPFRLPELKKDRERLRPESPWETLHIEELVIDLIRLCHWHYLETENPLFVFRAIEFGQHLTVRNAHYMDWTQKYLVTAAASIARLVARPPAAEDAEAAFATALEFERDKYKNSFRQAAAIIEADDLYDAVRRLIQIGVNTTDAMHLVAKKRSVSYEKTRAIYYKRRRLARTEATRFNSSMLIPLDPPRF